MGVLGKDLLDFHRPRTDTKRPGQRDSARGRSNVYMGQCAQICGRHIPADNHRKL